MSDTYRTRLTLLGVLIMGLVTAMGARLWYLQVVSPEEYQVQAEANLIRTQQLQAPRGRVFDRNGNVLIDTRVVNEVTVDKYEMNDVLPEESQRRKMAVRLAREISATGHLIKADAIAEAFEDPRYGAFDVIPIASDVTEEFAILLGERLDEFPGVDVQPTTIRDYPYRETAAHVLGYVGPIAEDELEARENSSLDYSAFDEIGKAGVERSMEDQLRGTPGYRRKMVDASHNLIEVLDEVEPIPGSDVYLTIDIDIQARLEEELRKGIEEARTREETETVMIDGVPTTRPTGEYFKAPAGASVLLDPRDGSVIAMASYPTYDPQLFVGGISQDEFDELTDEAAHKPLWNRAVQEAYSPGSTFKLITAYAALDSGLLGPRGIALPTDYLPDNGLFQIPGCDEPDCFFQNAGREDNGAVDLVDSLVVSSDVYYYRLGYEFDDRLDFDDATIQKAAEKMGLGHRTGIALPLEAPGLMPTKEKMQKLHQDFPDDYPFGANWSYGKSIQVAIGQGDVLASPLQMALAYASFANGGTVFQPSIATKLVNPMTKETSQVFEPRVSRRLFLPDSIRNPILAGLRGVVSSPEPLEGTAYEEFQEFPFDIWDVAAKTGTVERTDQQDSSVFAAFAPVDDPQYVMFTYVENGGFGAETAGVITRDMFTALATDDITRQPTAQQVEDYYRRYRPRQVSADGEPVALTGDVATDMASASEQIAGADAALLTGTSGLEDVPPGDIAGLEEVLPGDTAGLEDVPPGDIAGLEDVPPGSTAAAPEGAGTPPAAGTTAQRGVDDLFGTGETPAPPASGGGQTAQPQTPIIVLPTPTPAPVGEESAILDTTGGEP